MRKIYNILFEGMGTGQKSGMDRAKTKLKNSPDGSVAICRFYNGHSAFIKSKGKVRPITDEEMKRVKAEK